MAYKILAVDDEESILQLIKYNLEKEGYQVVIAMNGNEAYQMAKSEKPDLIILDVMLPEIDGFAVCRMLNKDTETDQIPIIMLSARSDEFDKVLGLEIGADDYMTKPFSPRELIARVKVRLRRQSEESNRTEIKSNILSIGGLVIDEDRFTVTINGVSQDLTPKEFELLRYMARYPGKVFSRDLLLEKIWGYDYAGDSRTVDVHIRHIRQKFENNSTSENLIETVRGVGYRFKEVN